MITGDQVKESSLRRVGSAQGLTNWALVSSNGKLIRGSNVRLIFRFGTSPSDAQVRTRDSKDEFADRPFYVGAVC